MFVVLYSRRRATIKMQQLRPLVVKMCKYRWCAIESDGRREVRLPTSRCLVPRLSFAPFYIAETSHTCI